MRVTWLVLLALSGPAFADGVPGRMRACVLDADCVELPDPCGTPSAVNKKFLEAAKKLVPEQNCLYAKVAVTPRCDDGQCTLGSIGLGGLGVDPTGHTYDKPAEEYARSFDDPKRDAWQLPGHVVQLVDVKPGMTVADIGAGTGYFEGHLDRAVGDGGRVLAVDVTENFVRYLEARGQKDGWKRVQPLLARRDDPGLEAGSVDRVLIVDTWHHISGREAYAKKLAAALRPGGTVTVVELTRDSPYGPPAKHRLPPLTVLRELGAAGLDAKVVKEKLPRQYVVIARKPAS